MAVGSQFLSNLGLDRYGLAWGWPEIDCAHPLDGGRADVLYRWVETTADGLGEDGRRWQRLFGWPSARFDTLADDIMGPLLKLPHQVARNRPSTRWPRCSSTWAATSRRARAFRRHRNCRPPT